MSVAGQGKSGNLRNLLRNEKAFICKLIWLKLKVRKVFQLKRLMKDLHKSIESAVPSLTTFLKKLTNEVNGL